MDATSQILLVVMLLVLGATLTIIGVQVFLILKELRRTAEKLNLMLDDAQQVTSNLAMGSDEIRKALSSPWAALAGLAGMAKSLFHRQPQHKAREGEQR